MKSQYANLLQVQGDLQQFILDQVDAQTAAQHIAERPKLSVSERLSIYHNGYRARLREALAEAYEKTHAYLGDTLFDSACNAYIAQYPSQQSSLRWFGDQFSVFLSSHLPDYPFIAELAAFEWALGLAFDAEDQVVLSMDHCRNFSAEDWASIGFRCQASVQFLQLRWNCVAIWLALNEEQTPPTAIADSAQTWLIWRKQLQSHFRSLSEDEYLALQGMENGRSFAEVCANAAEQNPEVAPQIAIWLQTWVNEEVLRA